MIKLNNKNITYVALADSNNSIKAPKEIWYADTNNSVKLVYRRKDALIEGEDYEKYHWLVSNSEDSKTPYIDTLIPPDSNQNIAFSFKVINSDNNGGEPGVWSASLSSSWSNCVIRCYKNTSYGYLILEFNNNNADFPQRENMIIKTEFSEGKEYDCSLSINSSTTALGVINNESKELVANSNVSFVLNPQPTHKLFVQVGAQTWSFNSVGFKRFNINNLISLIPCKLLKPVPKWLDANGIRRQVGECGMIDLVSGKFYGNVNSVGTFTVENYYERKEWLVGDGSAYISGITYNLWDNHLVSQVYNINKKYVQFVQSDINNSDRNISMTRNSIYLQIIFRELSQTNITHIADLNPNDFSGAIDLDYYISDSNFNVKVNGVTYTNASGVYATESKWKSFNGLSIYSEMMSYIREITPSGIYVSNLIPCTLTMDLPASMDANNIARTKGTSGMWDLVSDRFYGNVANSGTFKAVNLADGVDYEVHQWLVGDGNAYINTLITSYSGIIKVAFKSTESIRCAIFGREALKSDFTDRLVLLLFPNSNNKDVSALYGTAAAPYALEITDLNDEEITIDLDNQIMTNKSGNSIQINVGVNVTGSSLILFAKGYGDSVVNAIAPSDVAIKKFSVSNQINLIPVKLLKSIPSKYDANGIARQAGECGMYDTVSGKFFGNVANRGTFSVSD